MRDRQLTKVSEADVIIGSQAQAESWMVRRLKYQ